MMLTPQDVLKIIEEIEEEYPEGECVAWEDYGARYGNMWDELKDKLEKMRMLR